MPTADETIEAAERLLRDVWGEDVALDREAEVLATHQWPTVLRARVSGGPRSSVVIKTYRSWAPYDPLQPDGPASGLFAEWAGLALLGEVLPGDAAIAGLVAASRDLGVLVLDDLGAGQSIDDVLMTGTRTEARSALIQLAGSLARLHGATIGRRDRYTEIRQSLGPSRDRQPWFESMWAGALRAFAELEVKPAADAMSILERARDAMVEPGAWSGLCHSEAGDGNVIVVDDVVKVVDFEGSQWGHVGEDVAFLRMAFGHLPTTACVPTDVVSEFEATYAVEFARYRPELASALSQEITTASLWLALVSIGCHYKLSFDESHAPFGGERGRRQLGSQWAELARSDEPVLRGLATKTLGALAHSWSVDTAPTLPTYPAFDRS